MLHQAFKPYFLLALIVLLLSSCGQKDSLPLDIWPRERMVEILTEAQLTEAKIVRQKLSKQQQDSLSEIYYNEMFAYYNIDKEMLQKNIEYYKNKPKVLEEIYTDVISNLSILESQLNVENEAQSRADTLPLATEIEQQ